MPPIPNRLILDAPGVSRGDCYRAATTAYAFAKWRAPKLTGRAAMNIHPDWGDGWFGLHWEDDYLWFQEVGINPFTMKNLAGKTIPMWIDDPTGRERAKNPKARTRTTASGKMQVLIFRRAAKQGQRKMVRRNGIFVSVPASYPGAPGRIGLREAPAPFTRPGAVGGQIARTNVGVRWRHPGLSSRSFLHSGMTEGARAIDLKNVGPIYAMYDRSLAMAA